MKNATEIVLLLDESGSMNILRKATIDSVNKFLAEQAAVPGECNVEIAKFADRPPVIVRSGPVATIGKIGNDEYIPGGGTRLYGAIIERADALGARLSGRKEEDRPNNVVFAIITDGLNNVADWLRENAMAMIKYQTEKYNWKFVYLGAGPEAFSQGIALGINMNQVAQYQGTEQGIGAAYMSLGDSIKSSREGGSVDFTDSQRNSMR